MGALGSVFTRNWVVGLVLDVCGYTPDYDLASALVVEPACGDGAFLRAIASRLCESVARRGNLTPEAIAGSVRAYDIDETAVHDSRLAVMGVLAGYGLSEADAERVAQTWVLQGDFLLTDMSEARWVVGNPPYVRSSMIDRALRKTYIEALSCMTMGSDLYVGFVEKGLSILSSDGALCYICADRWLQNRYGSRLRGYVAASYSLDTHLRMHGVDAFEDGVSAYPAVSLLARGPGRPVHYVECAASFCARDVAPVKAWLAGDGKPASLPHAEAAMVGALSGPEAFPIASPERLRQLAEISRRHPTLEEAGVRLGIGVASGCDEVYVTEDPDLVEVERLLPLFFMRDYRAGRGTTDKFLVNPWDDNGELVDLGDWPRMRDYLMANEGRLRRRAVARRKPDAWYRTLDKPDLSLMGREMLLFPDMAARSDPVLSDGSRYPHHNCYWMTSGMWDVRALGGLLMGEVAEGYVDAYGVKMRGSTLRFQAQYLRMVHIPHADAVDGRTKAELALAFEEGDRERADAAGRMAYGL